MDIITYILAKGYTDNAIINSEDLKGSGIYIGSGDMPKEYDVQIDPEGEGIEVYSTKQIDEMFADLGGGFDSNFFINITESDLGEYTSDKSFAEINAAYGAGKHLVCNMTYKDTPIILSNLTVLADRVYFAFHMYEEYIVAVLYHSEIDPYTVTVQSYEVYTKDEIDDKFEGLTLPAATIPDDVGKILAINAFGDYYLASPEELAIGAYIDSEVEV